MKVFVSFGAFRVPVFFFSNRFPEYRPPLFFYFFSQVVTIITPFEETRVITAKKYAIMVKLICSYKKMSLLWMVSILIAIIGMCILLILQNMDQPNLTGELTRILLGKRTMGSNIDIDISVPDGKSPNGQFQNVQFPDVQHLEELCSLKKTCGIVHDARSHDLKNF